MSESNSNAVQEIIGFFELEGWEEPIIKKRLPDSELYYSQGKITASTLPEKNDFTIISVFVNSRITKEVLRHFPHLKLITARSTGFDHIDVTACRAQGIEVAYVPGYGDNTVAEFAFGLLLNLTRKIYDAIDRIKETGEFSPDGLRGIDIKGKTLGVVGTGRIGREVITIAKGFGMKVLAYDPFPKVELATEMDYKYVPLEELLQNSDVVTLHAPYNKDTHHLLNKKNISLMKPKAYIVNTARGGLVETEALVKALSEGKLAGVAIDVLEEEGGIADEFTFLKEKGPKIDELKTILANHVLMRMPNVLITPHNAFNSEEALQRILETTIQNTEAFLRGESGNLVPQK